MRKKILLTIFAMILCMPILSLKVKAADNDSNISYQKIDGVYFYLVNNSTGAVDTNHVTKFFLNGKIAYCIEPMVDINTRVYSSTNDWNVTGLSVENRRYIERIGYFGYEYAGHGNDRYWLAAQQLIWEKVNPNVSAKFNLSCLFSIIFPDSCIFSNSISFIFDFTLLMFFIIISNILFKIFPPTLHFVLDHFL